MTVTKLIEELRACPFCGGEAKMSKYKSFYMVECSTCGATIGHSINLNDDPDTLNTRDEVMEAWNLRDVEPKPERTCRNAYEYKPEDRGFKFVCTECGYDFPGPSNFCSYCGAKVVDDEGSCE